MVAKQVMQPHALEEPASLLQAKTGVETHTPMTPVPAEGTQSLHGSGQPLPDKDRNFFESRFGHDFSRVRVHTNPRAAELAQAINARAFTIGRDMVFAATQYAPHSQAGRRLIAHELTHVVQQSQSQRSQRHGIHTLSTTSPLVQCAPSRLIPDLEDRTVRQLQSELPMARSDIMHQRLLDLIVADRSGKGTDFTIMVGNHPVSSSHLWTQALAVRPIPAGYSLNGRTIPPNTAPVNTHTKPLVLIGNSVFGPIRDPGNATLVQQFVVRLYSSVMHEYQHALQWRNPSRARAMGQERREVEAFFWEIEHSRDTGLRGHINSFRNIWSEAQSWWRAFQRSTYWSGLSAADRQAYLARYQRVSRIANSVLRTQP
jgi:hypothetical protein